MSAGMPGPLPIIFSDDPGIERQERRGRSRERADMAVRLGLHAGVRPSATDHSVERNSSTVLANAIDDRRVVHLGPGVVEERVIGVWVDVQGRRPCRGHAACPRTPVPHPGRRIRPSRRTRPRSSPRSSTSRVAPTPTGSRRSRAPRLDGVRPVGREHESETAAHAEPDDTNTGPPGSFQQEVDCAERSFAACRC